MARKGEIIDPIPHDVVWPCCLLCWQDQTMYSGGRACCVGEALRLSVFEVDAVEWSEQL